MSEDQYWQIRTLEAERVLEAQRATISRLRKVMAQCLDDEVEDVKVALWEALKGDFDGEE